MDELTALEDRARKAAQDVRAVIDAEIGDVSLFVLRGDPAGPTNSLKKPIWDRLLGGAHLCAGYLAE